MDWLNAGRAIAGILVALGFVVLYLAPFVNPGRPQPALITAILFIALIGALLGVDVIIPSLLGDGTTEVETGADDPPPSPPQETTRHEEPAAPTADQLAALAYQLAQATDDTDTDPDTDATDDEDDE